MSRTRRGTLIRLLAALFLVAACSSGASPGAGKPDTEALFAANNRGAALMEQYKPAQALEEFSKVTTIAPAWAPGQVNLGLAALYARQMERATQAFQEAIRLDPKLVAAHYGLATLQKGQGQSAEALAGFEAAQKLDPSDPDILYNIGLLYGRQRQFDRAIAALRQAKELDPNGMSVRYQLARALVQSGQAAEGEKEMAAYQKLAANPRFAVPTGNQYGEAGRYALVITDYTGLAPATSTATAVAVRFRDGTEKSGITFRHTGPGGEAKPGDLGMRLGSGVAVGDLDSDGLPDIVFANSKTGKDTLAIYRNSGKGTFVDVTAASKVRFDTTASLGVVLADEDNDGDLDLTITGSENLAIFLNDGKGTFPKQYVLGSFATAGMLAGAAWGDFDHDGDLDLLFTRVVTKAGQKSVQLWRNRGDGGLEDVTSTLPVAAGSGAIGAVFSDLDLDRDLDVVIAGAGGPDIVLDNRREDGLVDLGAKAGLRAV
ncbi:MAG TPA: FG-GAP-like repeat-containing protein, partial [Candidatus Polarisedimenticolia bacterium]|nr:FG-GAP-like repeat-containing protein [Candidatus Polarisedimenticolia bacterium]